MTSTLRNAIEDALEHAARSIAPGAGAPVILEKPRLGGHGDFSTNLALLLAKECGAKPRDLAGKIVGRLKGECGFCPGTCERIEIAGPGFINLFIAPAALQGQLAVILGEGGRYGLLAPEQSQNIQLEFVSANPTGPLTVAHGRQAAMGDSLARILARAGHRVTREYYLNDRGKQIQLLGASAFERYKELFGQEAHIPEGGYLGGYIVASGENIKNRDGNRWLDNLNLDEGKIVYFADSTAEDIRKTIVKDLEDFRVHFDHWTSEKEFSKTGKIEECIEFLRGKGVIYEKDGAVWFRTGSLGDDKDRVLVKSDGERTYFAPDIAYHRDKFSRGFDRVIDFWGPDHHGYIKRMKAAVKALGCDEGRFTAVIVQLTTLFRGAEKLAMSTRAGEFITLREVMDEAGVDAARYFFARMRTDSHLNFDLELAKKHSNDNPVYYVQYVHARICSIFRKFRETRAADLPTWENAPLELLRESEELNLIRHLADFPFAVARSADTLEPNIICNYLEELATAFHQCYTEHTVISDDERLTRARLALIEGVRIVVKEGLGLVGVEAPERM